MADSRRVDPDKQDLVNFLLVAATNHSISQKMKDEEDLKQYLVTGEANLFAGLTSEYADKVVAAYKEDLTLPDVEIRRDLFAIAQPAFAAAMDWWNVGSVIIDDE